MLSKAQCVSLLARLAIDRTSAAAISGSLCPFAKYGNPAGEDMLGSQTVVVVAKTMYPDDADQNLTPIKVAGDGNCLYRAISILMCGNENQHLELRLRCVLELAQNPEYYAQECLSFAQEATDSGKTNFCLSTLLSATLSTGPALDAFHTTAKHSSLKQAYQLALVEEVSQSARPGTYASLQHIMALASVIGVKIKPIYPKLNQEFRSFLSNLVVPRLCSSQLSSSDLVLSIMWTSCQKHHPSRSRPPGTQIILLLLFRNRVLT